MTVGQQREYTLLGILAPCLWKLIGFLEMLVLGKYWDKKRSLGWGCANFARTPLSLRWLAGYLLNLVTAGGLLCC